MLKPQLKQPTRQSTYHRGLIWWARQTRRKMIITLPMCPSSSRSKRSTSEWLTVKPSPSHRCSTRDTRASSLEKEVDVVQVVVVVAMLLPAALAVLAVEHVGPGRLST
mmetsp:Transcript_105565/g.305389  ORF Transcript_105565/g.305389 Transcript_105565/m.305389 type:complete len:108 (-) Transcript_105565:1446-1769(-)